MSNRKLKAKILTAAERIRQEGIQLRNVYVVQQMLEAVFSKDQINNFTGLTPTQIIQIAEQLGLS